MIVTYDWSISLNLGRWFFTIFSCCCCFFLFVHFTSYTHTPAWSNEKQIADQKLTSETEAKCEWMMMHMKTMQTLRVERIEENANQTKETKQKKNSTETYELIWWKNSLDEMVKNRIFIQYKVRIGYLISWFLMGFKNWPMRVLNHASFSNSFFISHSWLPKKL